MPHAVVSSEAWHPGSAGEPSQCHTRWYLVRPGILVVLANQVSASAGDQAVVSSEAWHPGSAGEPSQCHTRWYLVRPGILVVLVNQASATRCGI